MEGSRKILVVEDEEDTSLFISQILENHYYQYSVARNGKEALGAMMADPPSLVLLDIMMPRKSGLNVYQEMKREEKLQNIPIVFVTGASQVTGVDIQTGDQEGKETYGDDFARGIGKMVKDKFDSFTPEGIVEKPIDPEALLEKIKQLLP